MNLSKMVLGAGAAVLCSGLGFLVFHDQLGPGGVWLLALAPVMICSWRWRVAGGLFSASAALPVFYLIGRFVFLEPVPPMTLAVGASMMMGVGLLFGLMQQTAMAADQQLQELFLYSGDGIAIVDPQERFLFANRAAETVFGVRAGGLVGRRLAEFLSDEAMRTQMTQRDRGETSSYALEILQPDGGERSLLVTTSPRVSARGVFQGTFRTFHDVTNLRKAEQVRSCAYRISEAAGTASDVDALFLIIHQGVSGLMGAPNLFVALIDPASSMLSFPYFVDERDDRPPPSPVGQGGLTEYMIQAGRPLLLTGAEIEGLEQTGQVRAIGSIPFNWMGVPLRSGGQVIGALVIQTYTESIRYTEQDLEVLVFVSQQASMAIERRRAQDSVLASEAKFRSLVDQATDGVGLAENDGHVVEWNPVMEQVTGVRRADALGRPIWEIIAGLSTDVDLPDLTRARHRELVQVLRGINSGCKSVVRVLKFIPKVGRPRTVRVSAFSIHNGRGTLPAVMVHDVTDEHQQEEELRRLSMLAEQSPVSTLITDPQGNITYVNPKFIAVSGYSREESLGQNPRILKSGETPAEVYRELWDRIRAGKAWHGEFHNRKKGGELHWERSSIFPIYNAAGQIISFVGLNEDITDSKEAEAEQEREGQLHRALDRLYEPLVSSAACMQDIMVLVLDLVCELTESRQALVETIDPAAESDGENPGVGLVARRGSAGPADAAADERWRQVLDSRRGFFTASPRHSLAAAAPAYLGVPVMAGAELLGRIAVSDPQDEYTEKDLEAVDRLARLFALGILNRRTQEELGRSKEAAEQATRAKSEFLASMSHEIRTPMNAILGLADLTLQGNLDEQQKEDLEQMHASGVSLLQLLNDILDLSKVEAGRVELEQVDFHLGETVESAMRTVAEMARTKRLDLRHEIAPDVPQALRGDPHRLRQVLLNLLSNAIKFTDEGQVLVRVVPELAPPGQVGLHFAVEDTGIGIPADRRAMIFDPFTQADPTVTRRHGGTGLGLAIAQSLVDCFGGRIWVESQEGQGSTFHFTVQLERSNAVDTRSEARLTRQEPTALPTWRLLLAEDNAVNQRLVSRLLAGVGWDVKIAQNGREAVEMSAAEEFDAILMDVRMPEMDGMVATQCIRQRERGTEKHIPIVALTADAMRETRERCLEVGMDRFLTKPATPDEMISVVRELVSGTQPPIPAQRGEAEPGQNAVFDLHAAMASVEGDYDLLSEVTQLFLQDLPHQLRTIKVGLENGDLPGVTRAAHTIKGAAATIGAHSLSSVARDMEQAARRDDLAFVVSRLPDLRQEGESLVRVLEAEHWRQTT